MTSPEHIYQPLLNEGFSNEDQSTLLHSNDADCRLEKRLVRKLDLCLLPFLSFMYFFSSLDRSSLGNAVLDNFEEDVGITPNQFNSCVMIFYAGFLLFQIPSNMMLKRFTARRWLPFLMIVWGSVACLHAAVKNFTHLMTLRFFLGVFEAGFFPGVIYFLTLFYTKDEMATRIAIFWGSTVAAHAYAGVLAYGILQMRGVGGMAGWQWLFLMEGIPTVLVAIIAYFYLPASPATWHMLSMEERHVAMLRMDEQHTTLGDIDASNKKQVYSALKDWKIWLWMIMFFSGSVANTSISNFLPLIVKGMGYTDKLSANLLTAPPYLGAVVVMIGIAHSSDRRRERTYHAVLGASVCALGYILLLVLTDRSALYAAICIAVAGIFTINPIVNAWLTSNLAPDMKKSVGAAMAVSANNASGLLGSNIYRQSDAPRYLRGHLIALVFLCLFIALALTQRYLLTRQNQKKQDLLKLLADQDTDEHAETDERIGDEALDFIYRL